MGRRLKTQRTPCALPWNTSAPTMAVTYRQFVTHLTVAPAGYKVGKEGWGSELGPY